MRWTKRAAGVGVAAIILGAVGMLAAHAECHSSGTFVGQVGYDVYACERDASNYDGGYTGRWSRPLYLWASDREQVASATTQAYVSQDRWAHAPSRTTYRDTILTAERWGDLNPIGQNYYTILTLRQTRGTGPDGSTQTTYADGRVYSYGAASMDAEVYADQSRSNGPCRQWAAAYLHVEGSTVYVPTPHHDCPAEAPAAPDFP